MSEEQFQGTTMERSLLNDFQRDLPPVPRPFELIARQLGVSEAEVLDFLRKLKASGTVSRVGPVFAPNRLGASTLAAISVPPDELARVASLVSRYPEVNHNYEREHRYNLWFVITAPGRQRILEVIEEIELRSELSVLELPMLKDYFIDLGFRIDFRQTS
ncbi:MAG: protein NirD [marine bacterium B5-7]|nr:MAG: protein NirD [marine bacterium B5-7]